MKKFIALGCLTIVMAMLLTACGKFTCDICQEEKSGEKHTKDVLGEEIVMCDDCYTAAEDAADALSDLF